MHTLGLETSLAGMLARNIFQCIVFALCGILLAPLTMVPRHLTSVNAFTPVPPRHDSLPGKWWIRENKQPAQEVCSGVEK